MTIPSSGRATGLAVLFFLFGSINLLATETSEQDSPATPPPNVLRQLDLESVSRLEWGILKLERYLEKMYAIDPTTLEPFMPPFYTNVELEIDAETIVIEVGRTFQTIDSTTMKSLCRDYVNQVRGFFEVDRIGKPIGKPYSSLTEDFFSSPTETKVNAEIARAT